MNCKVKAIAFIVGMMFVTGSQISATQILLSTSHGDLGYGYGFSAWDNMTSYLNTESSGGISTVSNFENYAQMSSYDAIWLDQRWVGGTLSATEISNISTFSATGKKVVLIGENSSWTNWNQQILSVVGGSFAGEFSGITNSIVNNELTAGVSQCYLPAAGIAVNGGTELFDHNFATLWGDNVLSVLDVNVFDDTYGGYNDNDRFARNVAKWISTTPENVPEPSTIMLISLGLVSLAAFRKRK